MDQTKLRREYPPVITMEQMYRICHISKRKARWLLENGVVPCEDSGKQTRRFHIRLDDVIDYLKKAEMGTLDVAPPIGAFSDRTHRAREPARYIDSDELRDYILNLWSDAPDALTAQQAVSLCGYDVNTVNSWLRKGVVFGVIYFGSNLISKESLASHLASHAGQRIVSKSNEHRGILEAFENSEQSSAMEMNSMAL